MSWHLATGDAPVMDTLSLLIVAIGSLAFLDLAAANLRGHDRSTRRARR
jgi:hypothetical protein